MVLVIRRFYLKWFVVWQLLLGAAFLIKAQNSDSIYTITSHKVEVQIFPSSSSLLCLDTIDIRKSKVTQSISLSLLSIYNIENLTLNGERIEYKRENNLLRIVNLPKDTILNLSIKYFGQFSFRSEFSKINTDQALVRDVEFLPNGPKKFEYVRIKITVPKDWETIAVGKLVAVQNSIDSSSYTWEFNQPLPEIGWLVAGKFKSSSIVNDGIPFNLHLFLEDSNSAPKVLDISSRVVNYYSKKFSPYRFPKLDIVEVDDWVAGGAVLAIACPSFIMVKKRAFTTSDSFNRVESILAHEIAHQWWPLTVFIEDIDVAFLAEGMCEYSSILYNENQLTKSRRDSLNNHPLLRPLMMKVQQGKDLPLQQRADLRTNITQYLKASYVHHMLRKFIGDSAFGNLYREFANQFSRRTATLSDFQTIAENVSGKQLNWFFDQWVKKSGIPRLRIYNVKTKQQQEGWLTQGRIRIVGYDKFTISGLVAAITDKGNNYFKFTIGYELNGMYRNDVPFEIITEGKPQRIVLDPDGDLLKLQKLPPKLSDLRDPSFGIMIVGTKQNYNFLKKAAEKDSALLEKAGWRVIIKHDTSVSLNDFQNERVFVYGKKSENCAITDIESKFPIRLSDDTLFIKDEKLYDSTLTLFEIIENPFMANGLITWIVPFNDKANSELIPYDESWVVVRGKDEIASGTWEVMDRDLIVEVK